MEGPQLTRETICSRAPAALMETLVHAFVVPALRKLREERGTQFVGAANQIKGRARRADSQLAERVGFYYRHYLQVPTSPTLQR